MKKSGVIFFFCAVFCLGIFVAHLFYVGNAIYGDGRYYYATARSLVIDGDLNFVNEYAFLKIKDYQLPTGYLANKYPPGSSFVWILPLILVHQITLTTDGYSFPYQIAVGFTTILFSIFGIALLNRTLNLFFERKISLLASLTILFSTNLLFYSSFDVINSHAISFALATLLLYLLFKFKDNNYQKWIFSGLTGGFLILTRTQDLLLLILPLFLLYHSKQNLFRKLKSLVLFIMGTSLTFFPQLVIWKIIYGSYFLSPYFNRIESFNFLNPRIFGVLFNADTGLILWTPFIIGGFIGLFFLKGKLKYLRNIFIAMIFLQFYLIASWSSWDQGASFGIRMLTSCLPLLAFGFAQLFKIYLHKYSLRSLYYFLGFSSLLNFSLIILYLVKH